MIKQVLFSLAILLMALSGYSASKYTIDDSKVEQLMGSSVQVNLNAVSDAHFDGLLGATRVQEEKNVWIAVALDFFLGGLGIHRVYLGANPGIIAGYFFTCGGIFGIVPLIDLIVLVINSNDISPYVNNKKFFMWGGN